MLYNDDQREEPCHDRSKTLNEHFGEALSCQEVHGLSSHKIISCVSSLFCPLTQVLSGCQGTQVGFIFDSSCGHLHFLDIFPGVRTWLFSGRFHWDSVETIICHPSV